MDCFWKTKDSFLNFCVWECWSSTLSLHFGSQERRPGQEDLHRLHADHQPSVWKCIRELQQHWVQSSGKAGGFSGEAAPLAPTHTRIGFCYSVIVVFFPAQEHLFQKSTAGQILRGFHRSGFQVSEWSCKSQMFILLFPSHHIPHDPIPLSPLSVKVALLPTTCQSSTSPQARRPPSTMPWPQWTSWWTRSSGTYWEQGTPCCSTTSCLQVESRGLTRQSGCVDGRFSLSGCGFSASAFKTRFCFSALDDRLTSSSFSREWLHLVEWSVFHRCWTVFWFNRMSILFQDIFSLPSMPGPTTSGRSSLLASPTIPTPPTPSCSGGCEQTPTTSSNLTLTRWIWKRTARTTSSKSTTRWCPSKAALWTSKLRVILQAHLHWKCCLPTKLRTGQNNRNPLNLAKKSWNTPSLPYKWPTWHCYVFL